MIKILTKGLTEQDKNFLKQGLESIKQFLPLEFTYQDTNATFQSRYFKNDVMEGYLLNEGTILDQVDGTDTNAFLFYDAKLITPNPTNPSTFLYKKGNTIPTQIPIQWYGDSQDALVMFFLHELCHAEFYRKGEKDLTHDFYSSSFVQVAGTGLRDYYLFLLKKLFNTSPSQPQSAQIRVCTITRYYGDKQTTGTLLALNDDKVFNCKTLERANLGNKPNVSCIPEGNYICLWTFSPKFMRYTYQVMNVPNRSGIRIHKGNYFWDVLGCILLGNAFSDVNKDGLADVINSTKTIQSFEDFFGRKTFILTIKNGGR